MERNMDLSFPKDISNDVLMNIPPLICSCGRFLTTKSLLGHYLRVFKPKHGSDPKKTKEYFVNTLKLHSPCCWNRMQTVHDPLEISLMYENSK